MQTETIRLVGSAAETSVGAIASSNPWWEEYLGGLLGLSPSARAVLDADAEYILEQGIFGAGGKDGDFSNWPTSRLRRGLVMGAVQSGKTASLLGVVAKALDAKVDIVVVLGGTRIALWKQTYRRLLSQLDHWTPGNDGARRRKRVLLPLPDVIDGDEGLDNLYFETPNLVRRALLSDRPLISVVMKQPDHLERFGRFLKSITESLCHERARPVHMLVIDDEADDGSILDSDTEVGEPTESALRKQIPRRIARLWSDRDPGGETYNEKLYCTYVAYTATPQSNFLQAHHNPLTPNEFICALRVPGSHGEVTPRSPTYFESSGLMAQYTGGETFYLVESDITPFCDRMARDERTEEESVDQFETHELNESTERLGDALRSFFVAGAIRLFFSGKRLSAVQNFKGSSEELDAILPAPHSMLIHPGAQVQTHFEMASLVSQWANGVAPRPGDLSEIDALKLCSRLHDEESLWSDWLQRFRDTRTFLIDREGASGLPDPKDSDWPEIRRLLETEVFKHTKLCVINSDPRSDDSPIFSVVADTDGNYEPPPNIYSIFVSGNVMARGLTLEGLTTTLFMRSSQAPAADTQMQMQRWFGYRGSYLNLCRVFLFEDQFQLFLGYHEADEALRREILGHMNNPSPLAPKPTVLQGMDFRATGKIANLRALPLSPGAETFLRIAESSSCAHVNESILTSLLATETWLDLVVSGTLRGIYVERPFTLVECAELLEQFRYSEYSPSPDGAAHRRWRSLEYQNNIATPEAPLFRPPGVSIGANVVAPSGCPYSVAAYLRLWNALLSRRARGICPTDRPDTPWSMIDLASYRATAPTFTIGIRFGIGGDAQNPTLRGRGVKRMERAIKDGKFVSTWGSRNPGSGIDHYLGDQLFDYHVTGEMPPSPREGEPLWRPRGHRGMILFHVVAPPSGPHDIVTAGIAIPLGGPDHIAALRGIS